MIFLYKIVKCSRNQLTKMRIASGGEATECHPQLGFIYFGGEAAECAAPNRVKS